jgi:hypothetical protein
MYQGSPNKKAPSLFGRSSVPQNEGILNDLQLFNTTGGQYLYLTLKELYRPLLEGLKGRIEFLETLHIYEGTPHTPVRGGEIHFLQEPGGKLRSIASPFRIHQEALKPFGDELYSLVRSLPWDCTFDQSKAIPFIQSHLLDGVVHSVDLSSATDHFPLDLQLAALRAVFHKSSWRSIDLFAEISRGVWKSPIGDLRWTKGQPLGLYPSFASFTLTHGLTLLHLNGGKHENSFFVVGDDVVILKDSLRDKYIQFLDDVSCPWSEDKSLSSQHLAEFAGKIISTSGVYPQLKWRRMSDDNFLDICRLLGKKSRGLLSRRQKLVFDRVQHLVEPIGLNFSYSGSNLTKMVEDTCDFYQPEKAVLGTLMGLDRKFNRLVRENLQEEFDALVLRNLSSTFDEKVKSVMCQTVFSRFSSSKKIGLEAFETLPSALGIESRLPFKEQQPTRLTTLERYERIIQSQD